MKISEFADTFFHGFDPPKKRKKLFFGCAFKFLTFLISKTLHMTVFFAPPVFSQTLFCMIFDIFKCEKEPFCISHLMWYILYKPKFIAYWTILDPACKLTQKRMTRAKIRRTDPKALVTPFSTGPRTTSLRPKSKRKICLRQITFWSSHAWWKSEKRCQNSCR